MLGGAGRLLVTGRLSPTRSRHGCSGWPSLVGISLPRSRPALSVGRMRAAWPPSEYTHADRLQGPEVGAFELWLGQFERTHSGCGSASQNAPEFRGRLSV